MDPTGIFTRKRMGLDQNVWVSMLLCIILSAGLFGYNYINKERIEPCKDIAILINGKGQSEDISFSEGKELSFRPSASTVDKIIWDFGDDTKAEGFITTHTYQQAAIYRVRATLNGRCTYERMVNIKETATGNIDSMGVVYQDIIGENEAIAGDSITFYTSLPATDYKWYIENSSSFRVRTGNQATFRFRRQGQYTVVLLLDNDHNRMYKKIIDIAERPGTERGVGYPNTNIDTLIRHPRPPVDTNSRENEITDTTIVAPPVLPRRFLYVSNEILKTYLQAMVCEEKNVNEFDAYLCQGVETPVIINREERMTFAQFFSKVKGKRIKILSVEATREDGSCIDLLTIKYTKIIIIIGSNPCNQ